MTMSHRVYFSKEKKTVGTILGTLHAAEGRYHFCSYSGDAERFLVAREKRVTHDTRGKV